jgi:hypothetical protein
MHGRCDGRPLPVFCPTPPPMSLWRQRGCRVPYARDTLLGATAPGQPVDMMALRNRLMQRGLGDEEVPYEDGDRVTGLGEPPHAQQTHQAPTNTHRVVTAAMCHHIPPAVRVRTGLQVLVS